MYKFNRFEKSFGPAGFNAGIALFTAGLVLIFFSLSGVALLLIGAFIGFSSQASLIDYKKKRAKYGTLFFGIIPSGRWLNIEKDMKLGIKKHKASFRAYSRSNQVLDTDQNYHRIVLFDNNNREVIPLKQFISIDVAQNEVKIMANKLGIEFNK